MSTATIEAPAPTSTTVANHYMAREDILASIVDGRPRTALCGDTFVPSSRGNGETSVAGARVCPACQTLYARLRD